MTRRPRIAAAVLFVSAASIALAGAPRSEFRSWAHVKSMVITDKSHGLYGFHNVYADPTALKAIRSGGAYAEGAQLAVSFYEVVADGPMLSQGKKLMDTFMRKDAAARSTGGWRFEASGPDGKPLAIDVAKACYECHAAGAKATDLVFSTYVE